MCPGSQPAMQNTPIALAIRMSRTIQAKMSRPDMVATSCHGLWLREFPFAIQDFVARAVEPHGVIPALHDRQTVRHLAVASAELDRDRAVAALLGGEVIECVGVMRVLLVVARGVVDTDRPEGVDGYVLDVQLVDRVAFVIGGRDVEIGRLLVGIAAPRGGRCDQVSYR